MIQIDDEIMLRACEGHVERMSLIETALSELGIDLDAARSAIKATVEARDDGSVEVDRTLYTAAMADGFVLAARACRMAEAQNLAETIRALEG